VTGVVVETFSSGARLFIDAFHPSPVASIVAAETAH
jgi:hypothetical protein